MKQGLTVRLLNRNGLSKPLMVTCDATVKRQVNQLVLIGWPDSEVLRIGVIQGGHEASQTPKSELPFVVTPLSWPDKQLRRLILKAKMEQKI